MRTVWAPPRSLAATRGIVSVPRGTEMFQFPHLPPPGLCVQPGVMGDEAHRVAPFGHRRRIACLRPTVAFRSLPRPSSAPVAEASSAYRFSLERDRVSPTPVSGSSERDSSTRRSQHVTILARRAPGQTKARRPRPPPVTAKVLILPYSHLHLLTSDAGATKGDGRG
jgi:hypothetical protein